MTNFVVYSLSVYCSAGKFISSTYTCTNCSEGSYKIESDYYATSRTQCPGIFPASVGSGSTKPEDCSYGMMTKLTQKSHI